jgi:hypothetical protein
VAEDIASRPKYFVGDEWHNTESAPNIQEIVTKMGREGPKYRIRITLASQMLKDFTKDMIALSSAMFVLSATEDVIKDLTERYNLTPAQQGALRKLGRRDSRLGQPIFAILNTILGQFSQLVYSAMSPRELWTAATDPQENTLRRHLTNRTGSFTEGVALIADYEPLTRRPVKDEIEARIKRRVEQGDAAGATEERVVADIVEDILSIRKERLLRARR